MSRHPSRAVPAASALQPLKSRNRATKTRHVDNSRQRRVGKPASGGEPGGTSASIHGLGYLFSALRRERLIADELVLQLATFLRSLDLFLELTVRTVPRTLTANQVQRGGKQGTDGPELSRIHSSTQHPRDKQRQASAPGADQQRLQHSRARQTYRSMLLLVLRCASRRPLTTRQTQYSPSCSALVSSSSASSSPASDACLARIARRAPHNSKSHLSTRFIGRQDATKIGIG